MNHTRKRSPQVYDLITAGTGAFCYGLIFCVAAALTGSPVTATAAGLLLIAFFSQYISFIWGQVVLSALFSTVYVLLSIWFYPILFHKDLFGLIITSGLFFGSAFAAGYFRSRVDEQKRQRRLELQRQQLLSELNAKLLSAHEMEPLQRQLLQNIYDACGRPAVLFMSQEHHPVRIAACPQGLIYYEHELAAVRRAFFGEITGVGTGLSTFSVFRCYPISYHEQVVAVVAVLLGKEKEHSRDQLNQLDQLIQRSAVVLERQYLADEQQRTLMEKQVEQTRANFLRAISHDLRSPLATIMGACSALQHIPDDNDTRRGLIADIMEESQWLIGMVENLLSVTRFNAGVPQLNLSTQAAEEIVAAAAEKSKTRFPQLRLSVSVPEELLLLQIDPTLMIEVLLNLIENAVKYGGQAQRVELSVVRDGEKAVFSVQDYGAGIPADRIGNIFNGLRDNSDSRHGLGLGLSICQTIVTAHRGEIWADNCPQGGTRFSFSLPLEEEENV